MTCRECSKWFCIVACDEVSEQLDRAEESIMDRERSINYMAWVTILFIISVAGSCAFADPIPQSLNMDNMRGACKYQAQASLK